MASKNSSSRKLPPLVEHNAMRKHTKNKELILNASKISQHNNKKKSRRSMIPVSEISRELDEMREDVITKTSEISRQFSIVDQYIPSQPDGKLYVEKKDKFRAKNKSDVEKKKNQVTKLINERWNEISDLSSIQQALLSHKIFKTVALFIHGLFSGIALWQIISTFVLLQGGTTNFLNNYSVLSMPIQCCYYFFYVICIISVLDRYDVWDPTADFIKKLLTLQNGAICIIFYIVGLITSLSNYKIDSYVWQHHRNSSFWTSIKDSEASGTVQIWQILNLTRGTTSILGWFIISLRPLTDHFTKSLDLLKNRASQN